MKRFHMRTIDLPWEMLVQNNKNVQHFPDAHRHFQRLRWLRPALLALFVLNVVDGLLTILWLQQGLATEANPMMAYLITIHPAFFMAGKLLIVFLGSMILLRFYHHWTAVFGVVFLLAFYGSLMLYHSQGFVLMTR